MSKNCLVSKCSTAQEVEEELCPVCQMQRNTGLLIKSFCDPHCGHKACAVCWQNYYALTAVDAGGGANLTDTSSGTSEGILKCPECLKSFAQLELSALIQQQEKGRGGEIGPLGGALEARPVAEAHSARLQETGDCLFHDSQNLAITNLPEWLRSAEELARWEFFGQYGQIVDILLPGSGAKEGSSRHAVIRYDSSVAALSAMRCTNRAVVSLKHPVVVAKELQARRNAVAGAEGETSFKAPQVQVCSLGVSLHPTRYCANFLLARPCTRDQCVELHEEVPLAVADPTEAPTATNGVTTQLRHRAPTTATPPRVISTRGANYLPMVNYNGAGAYVEKQLSASVSEDVAGSEEGTSPSTPTTATGVMDLINPNRQPKLSAGARPFIPGVGGIPITTQSSENRETRISTWQGVLTEEMALMAQIQSLRKDHTAADWETTMFEPVVFPFTQGLALPSPAQKDSTDEKMLTEHRLHKVVDIASV